MKKFIGFALFLSFVTCLSLVAGTTIHAQSTLPTNATVVRNANLRAGPGTSFAVVGSAKAGQSVNLVELNAAGDWYRLASGEWIAAFLVTVDTGQPTVDASTTATPLPTQPVTATVTAPTATPAPPTATPTPEKPGLVHWQEAGVQTCNGFEWRVADVRTAKEVWRWNSKRVAMGQYLVIYTEIKNVGPGTNSLDAAARPTTSMGSLDVYSSSYAAWMMTGGHNVPWEEYNPGDVITVVAAFDVEPSDGHIYAMLDCLQAVSIGEWSKVTKGVIRAN